MLVFISQREVIANITQIIFHTFTLVLTISLYLKRPYKPEITVSGHGGTFAKSRKHCHKIPLWKQLAKFWNMACLCSGVVQKPETIFI